jgi:hypothetical protein
MSDDKERPFKMDGVPLPKPDSIEQIPSLHPATVRVNESLLRVVKNVVGIWETWLRERQR